MKKFLLFGLLICSLAKPEYFYVPGSGGGGGSGTVESVALTAPNIFSVSGSPVETTGTLALSLANQNANIVFAGPNTGAAAAPTFRALVAADIPDLSASYMPVTGDTSVAGTKTFTGHIIVGSATNYVRTVLGGGVGAGIRLNSATTRYTDIYRYTDNDLYIADDTNGDRIKFGMGATNTAMYIYGASGRHQLWDTDGGGNIGAIAGNRFQTAFGRCDSSGLCFEFGKTFGDGANLGGLSLYAGRGGNDPELLFTARNQTTGWVGVSSQGSKNFTIRTASGAVAQLQTGGLNWVMGLDNTSVFGLNNVTTLTPGAAGAATALPATPETYVEMKFNGTALLVPAYLKP